MVQVENSTLESEGNRKLYMLRVPPTMTDADEAVAWTFSMTKSEYHPSVET